jgi:peptidoglycan/xylan/chitin deacetylase (PgdA/CDA1 family)
MNLKKSLYAVLMGSLLTFSPAAGVVTVHAADNGWHENDNSYSSDNHHDDSRSNHESYDNHGWDHHAWDHSGSDQEDSDQSNPDNNLDDQQNNDSNSDGQEDQGLTVDQNGSEAIDSVDSNDSSSSSDSIDSSSSGLEVDTTSTDMATSPVNPTSTSTTSTIITNPPVVIPSVTSTTSTSSVTSTTQTVKPPVSSTSTPAVTTPVIAPSSSGTAPQAISGNLIPNSALAVSSVTSTGPTSWHSSFSGTNQSSFATVAGPNAGSLALQTKILNYTNGDAKWYFDPINVTPGDKYTFKDSYVSDVPSFVTVQFGMASGTYSFIDVVNPPVAANWSTATGNITVPSGAKNMTVFHLIKQVGSLSVSGLSLVKGSATGTTPLTIVSGTSTAVTPDLSAGLSKEGMVTLTFDDGFESQYQNAKPMLDAAGYKATFYVVSGFVNTPDYMTSEEVQNLDKDGMEIGAHTRTHSDLVALTADQLQAEIAGSKADLESLLSKPITTFDYPFGTYDNQVVQAVKDAGFTGARSVNAGFNTKNSDKFLLNDQHLENTVTVAQAQQWIDQAIANKTWLIMEIHDQNANGDQWSNSPATMQGIINYLKQKDVKVVTLNQGLQLMGK